MAIVALAILGFTGRQSLQLGDLLLLASRLAASEDIYTRRPGVSFASVWSDGSTYGNALLSDTISGHMLVATHKLYSP